ncbi:MBL fold metallo-hydrolase [Streptomyces spiralis]|uniref:MBL fold metallo-hydrolase n=1 Tax=Streptomyces spiralis TaxID=66376 RepID=UPI001E4B64D3|nr:MBL fold metallo-hydrolase [Streptomyces spiralis]
MVVTHGHVDHFGSTAELSRLTGAPIAGHIADFSICRAGGACIVSDHQAEAEVTASFIPAAPEDLLTAVTRLIVGETECRARFEAEPTVFRWILCREGRMPRSVWACRRDGGGRAAGSGRWGAGAGVRAGGRRPGVLRVDAVRVAGVLPDH